MRVLITGGAGFIGSHLADAALAAGHTVAVLDDLSTGRRDNLPEGLAFFEADIRDGQAVDEAFARWRPEVVSHQAAQTSVAVSARDPISDAEVNVMGSLRVLEASVKYGVRHVVFASTGGAIYGEVDEGQRAAVGRPTLPSSPYGAAKLAVEHYLTFYDREHGLPSTVLRYANVYGPRQDPHGEAGVVAIFCERLLRGESVQINARRHKGDPGCVRDYVYVGDVVAANLRALDGSLPVHVLNVGTGVACETLALAEQLIALTGQDTPVGYGPRRAGDLERSVLEPSPELSQDLVALEEGLGRTVQWFRERS